MTDYQIWPATDGPGASSADASVNLATEFSVSTTCWLKAIRFWRADTNITGTVLGRVWLVSTPSTGTAVAGTDVTFTLSGTGWLQADLAVPVELSSGVRYKAACLFPSGYSATANYWSSGEGSAGITNGILTAPNETNSAGGDTQGCFAYNAALTYPDNGSPNAGNYWVDVVVTDIEPGGGDVTGTGSAVLGALTGTASGVPTTFGAGVIALGALAATASGTRTVNGVAAAALGGLGATASGGRTVVAAAVAGLGGLSGTATGTRTTFATANAALGVMAATITGRVSLRGTAAASLGALTAAVTIAAQQVISTGSWDTLLAITREARQLAEAELSRPPTACPNDGEPLRSHHGVLHCAFDGWTYP